MDTNRAKREFVIEVSPVHIVLSESRITRLSLIVPPGGFQAKQPQRTPIREEGLPPRLELLAIFLLSTYIGGFAYAEDVAPSSIC
jgi:hypothetical protein